MLVILYFFMGYKGCACKGSKCTLQAVDKPGRPAVKGDQFSVERCMAALERVGLLPGY